jgi:ABC-type polysaccharide/polyol phosphate transport system ATPase subunit
VTSNAIEVTNVRKTFRLPLDHAPTLQYRVSHLKSSSRYRELRVLDGVTFQVERGEFFGIVGPNGCGKSTLLKILSGIYEPDGGNVAVNGSLSPFLELGVGFKPDLTARENILLGGTMLGLTRREVMDRADTVLEFAELEDFAEQKLKNYSSGMAVRLAFSVAMMADADILLMDEVLAVGDSRFQEKCFEVFAEYKRKNRTIILVSHSLSTLDLFCYRVLLLQSGSVVACGPAAEVISRYRRIVASMSEHQRPAGDAVGGSSTKTRWGSGEVEVTDIQLLEGGGEPRSTFLTDEPMTVVVEYAANSYVHAFQCGIRIRLTSGQVVSKPFTSRSQSQVLEVGPGMRGSFTYSIPELTLLEGTYCLSAYLYDEHLQHAYDHVEDALEFRVADEAGRMGVFELGGTWQASVTTPAEAMPSAATADR